MSESETFAGRYFPEARAAVAAHWQLLVILVANLVPVFGVVFLEWGIFLLLLLYWLENVIIGLFVAMRLGKGGAKASQNQELGVPFFLVHYGVFMFVHGFFLVAVFLEPKSLAGFASAMGGWWWAIVCFGALLAEHGYSYHLDHLRGGKSQGAGVAAAYGRLVIMHVTIIGGGFAAQSLGSPIWALLMLIVLKTCFDLAVWIGRLPEAGFLGRIKAAFRSGLQAAVMIFVLSLVLVIPTAVIGSVISGVMSSVAGRRMEPEAWILGGGFAAAGILAVVGAASAWLHEMLSGLRRYRQSGNTTKAAVVMAIVALLVASGTWPAVKGYRAVRAQMDAVRSEQRRPEQVQSAFPPSGTGSYHQPSDGSSQCRPVVVSFRPRVTAVS